MGLFNQRSEKNRVGSPPQYMTENISEELIRLEDLVKIYDTGALKVLGQIDINEYLGLPGPAVYGTLLSGWCGCGGDESRRIVADTEPKDRVCVSVV